MKNFYIKTSLGIDIKEDSVCLTLLGKTFLKTEILASKHISIQLLSKENEKAEAYFLSKVNLFLIKHNAWTGNLTISIPRSKLTLQSFELPSPDRESLDSMMEFELERHFSSDIKNFYYSNHITAKEGNQYHIVCAAIKKEIVDYYIGLLAKLNLKPANIDVSTFANINLLWPNIQKEKTLSILLDLSLNFIDVSILNNKTLELSRNIPINNEEYKTSFLSSGQDKIILEKTSDKIVKSIVEEIENALSSCKNIDDSKHVEFIYFLGGGSLASYITSKLEAVTEVQVITVPFTVPIKSKMADSSSMDYTATSLGLALRETKTNFIEINLLPDNLKKLPAQVINIKKTATLTLITILFIVGFMVNQSIHNNKTLAALDQQLEQIKKQMGPLEKIDLEYESLQKYMGALNIIDKANPTKLPLLVELSRIIPKDTWVKKIKLSLGTVELIGISKNASRLLPIVENSNHFRDTKFIGTITTHTTGEKFTINATVGATK